MKIKRSNMMWWFQVLCLCTVMHATHSADHEGCPDPFPCDCHEFKNGNKTFLNILCSGQKLVTVPDLTPLVGKSINLLDLSANDITVINDGTFAGLVFPESYNVHSKLKLMGNPITSISKNAFSGITEDNMGVDLGDTELSESPLEPLRQLPNMRYLHFANTKITHIPDNSFKGLSKLVYLDLSGNQLGDIGSKFLADLEESLTYLELNNIGLTQFPTEALKRLHNIYEIDLEHNQIENLSKDLFAGFPKYKIPIDVSLKGNPIKSISPLAFSKNNTEARIGVLRISDAGLENLDFLFDPCSLLISPSSLVYVRENPLICDCKLFSVINTGIYTIRGTCVGPEGYVGQKIDVQGATDKPGPLSYADETYYERAIKECAGNMTEWDLSCGQWVPYQTSINSASLLHLNLLACLVIMMHLATLL